MNISKFCKKKGISVKKFINFMLKSKIFELEKEKNEEGTFPRFFIKNEEYIIPFKKGENLDYEKVEKLINGNLEKLREEDKDKPFVFMKNKQMKEKIFLDCLNNKKILFIDFEKRFDKYSEVGMILMEEGEIKTEESYLDKNLVNIGRFKKKLEKYKKYDIKLPKIKEISWIDEEIKSLIKGVDVIISHGVGVERKMLKDIGINVEDKIFICSEKLTNEYVDFYNKKGEIKNSPKLIEVARHFKIKVEEELIHNPYYDSFLTKESVLKLKKEMCNNC